MEEKVSPIRVFGLDPYNYPKFRGKIIRLYLNAFTTGGYAQYIPSGSAESALDEMLRNGWGNMAFSGDELAGVLIALPLSYDKEFPRDRCPQVSVETSVYIAEVMTHSDFRGKGVASELLESFLQKAKDNYTDVIIRVWDENEPALSLYEKMGFKKLGVELVQTKLSSPGEEFKMRKIYMKYERLNH